VKRNLGTGLLVAGACGACWIAPLLVALLGAGWAGALGAGWAWAVVAGCAGLAGLVLLRRIRRRRQGACGCASPTTGP
jgi:hypothetical protein